MKQEYHILNLGAGVQSTTLYLMFHRGELQPKIDYAIFADTQDEPKPVYEHLEWMQSLNGPPILVGSIGKLSDHLIRGRNLKGNFGSIPAFTTAEDGTSVGRQPRQCSRDYKVDVIGRVLRREILGMIPKQRVPKGIKVHQYFGISLDEARRTVGIRERFKKTPWATPHFPLVEKFWTRPDCLTYLHDKVPHVVPKSACVECPFRSDAEWQWLKTNDPEGFERAVVIDHALRTTGSVANRDMRQVMYLHRSCQPLDLVQLDTRPRARDLQLSMSFAEECLGVCGN